MSGSDFISEVPTDIELPYISRGTGHMVSPSKKDKSCQDLATIKITHDGSLSIATGRSRKELHWKNREVLWSKLLEKLSKTIRTPETQKEYVAMPKTQQDDIKDVGGFVGGRLKDGHRKAGNVLDRSLLTLDADFPGTDLWDTFRMFYDCAACIYSTHKHSQEKPRLRLVIPLKRLISAIEYEAVARKVAESIGIDAFDDTTFQAERLMYWPSTSSDGDYYFKAHDGKWMDPDAVLAEYENWQDRSTWPVSSRSINIIAREIKKAEDPTTKTGIVGAFCRAYNIHEVIETFLANIYEKCDAGENRYTYLEGSTAGGLITYENKWAFSHHGTDPASGKLCNAFDLVRIHKFHQLDEAAAPHTPVSKLPSYIAMQELATTDELIRLQLGKERLQSALDDFGEIENEDSSTWTTALSYERSGKIQQTIENAYLIITNDAVKNAKLLYNDFAMANEVKGELRWKKPLTEVGKWSDADYAELVAYLEKHWGITSERVIKIALKNVFSRNRYHPVIDHLRSLKWDGVKRVETLLVDYLGVEDSDYTRAVIRKTLAAAVARVFNPGCKFDYVLVIVGPQGIGKSMFVQKLGYCADKTSLDEKDSNENRNWYSDNFSLSGRGDKRDVEQLLGVWLMEIPELSALYGKSSDAIKSFISTRQDEVRLAYQVEKGYYPRQCIFVGTTNNMDFLSDTTGNRRFWPVVARKQRMTKNIKDDLPAEVDQIWAEAVQIFKAGEPLYLDDPKLEAIANAIQEQHRERDAWEDVIAEFLEKPAPPDYWENPDSTGELCEEGTTNWVLRDKVTISQLWRQALGEFKMIDTIPAKRIRKIMRSFDNWEDALMSENGKTVRGFKRLKK